MTENQKENFYRENSVATFIRQHLNKIVRLYWQGLLHNCEVIASDGEHKNIFKNNTSYPFSVRLAAECATSNIKTDLIKLLYSKEIKYCLDYYDANNTKLHYFVLLPDSIISKKNSVVIYNELQYNEELNIIPEECLYHEYGRLATAENINNDLDKYEKLVLMLENVIDDTEYWTTSRKEIDNLIEYSFTSEPFNSKFGYINISLSANSNDPNRYYFNVVYKNDYQTYTHSQTNEENDNMYSRLSKFIDSEFFNDSEPMTDWDISEDERKMLTDIMTELKEAVENKH